MGSQENLREPRKLSGIVIRRIGKLLHFNFLLRALGDLRGEMSVSILVAASPR
jgi:hypothetical protein